MNKLLKQNKDKKSIRKKLIILIILLVILPIAWYLISPAFIVVEVNEEFPVNENAVNIEEMKLEDTKSEPKIINQAEFVASAHDINGKALVIEENDKKILRFEDFETINGPDLFIYLSSDLDAKDFINLGEIKATKGNVNYEIPSDVDLIKYNKVLVWCRAFRVLFSYAEFR